MKDKLINALSWLLCAAMIVGGIWLIMEVDSCSTDYKYKRVIERMEED